MLPGSERYLVMVMEDTRLELSGTGRAVVEVPAAKGGGGEEGDGVCVVLFV